MSETQAGADRREGATGETGAQSSRAVTLFGVAVLLLGGLLLLGAPRLPAAALREQLWSLDHLRDTPGLLRVLLLAAVGLALVPRAQRAVVSLCEAAALRWSATAPKARGAVAIVAAAAFFALLWALRHRNYELGDSALLIQQLTMYVHGEGFHVTYDEPLDLYLHSIVYRWLHAGFGWGVEDGYAVLSCLAGLAYVAAMFAFWRGRLSTPGKLGCALGLVSATASVQLFFGYVENYTLVAAALMLYVVLAAETLEGRRGLFAPALALGASISLHVLAGWLLPSLIYVWWRRRTAGAPGGPASLAALIAGVGLPLVATALYLTALGVPPASVQDTHLAHLKFIFLIEPGTPQFRYPAWSLRHLRDIANEWLLVSLPGVLAALGALIALRSRIDWRDPLLHFLAIGALFVHLFAASWNPEISAYRDWDLFALSGFFDALLGAYLLLRAAADDRVAVSLALPILALALGLSGSWISSNATRSLDVPVRHDRAHVRAGQLLRRDGHEEEALAEFEAALGIDASSADALYELGTARWNARRYREAEPLLRRFLEVAAAEEGEARSPAGRDQAAARAGEVRRVLAQLPPPSPSPPEPPPPSELPAPSPSPSQWQGQDAEDVTPGIEGGSDVERGTP